MRRLIEIAGIDGVGMTTLALSLQNEMLKRGVAVQYSSFLQGTDPFIKEADILAAALPPKERENVLAYLYSFRFVGRALKGLSNTTAELILIDRYISSHIISQKVFGVELKKLAPLFEQLPVPEMTLFLDVPVSVAIERLSGRTPKAYETPKMLRRANRYYKKWAREKKWKILDATLPVDRLTEEAINAIYIY